MQLRLASPLMRQRARTLAFLGGTALAAFAAGCDQSGSTTIGTNDPNAQIVAYAGFALTADDGSDDGFTDGADTTALDAAAGANEDPTRPPKDGEADPSAIPPGDGNGPRPGRALLVVWGQLGDNDNQNLTPTTWRGQIRIDGAAIDVVRALHFEDRTDKLIRDENPSTVSFETVTTGRNDGLLLRVARLPDATEPISGDLVFETEHFTQRVPLADIVAGNQLTFQADELGNELMVSASLPHRCAHGLMQMRWERKDENGGVFGGKILDDEGNAKGTVRGLWGSRDGKNRFKGEFKDEAGTFQGTIIGSYRASEDRPGGVFQGHWRTADGTERGVLGGVFTFGDDHGKGEAHGFWRAHCGDGPGACHADEKVPEPAAPSCQCAPSASDEGVDACACEVPPPATCVPPEPPADGDGMGQPPHDGPPPADGGSAPHDGPPPADGGSAPHDGPPPAE